VRPLNQSSAPIVTGRQTTVKAGLWPPPSAADGLDSGLPPSRRCHHRFDVLENEWLRQEALEHGRRRQISREFFDPAPDRRGFRQPSTREAASESPPRCHSPSACRRRPRAQPRIAGLASTIREVRRRLPAAPATNRARRFRIIRKPWVARANSVLSKIAHSEHVVVVVRR